ncbi:YfcL family protein [Rheinheimera sp. MMS21-TC3]|uniref:YfcL family protein n=1 Tax=Rheinheimera sp. MMS21-TC3 TaxID=3072790 RepID=UPI0028C394BE|nr:YfcL family protein [Rheinheimera sp. MMS21-TC3]WNO60734.1 YfcL family protein [Rheinheimera sp. MMS21-TC3]
MNSVLDNSVSSSTEVYINEVANFFDQLVPVATDDELFASGYLRGHFDLIVGTLQVSGAAFTAKDVINQVNTSLQQAISQGELDKTDQASVENIWLQVQKLASE